MFTSIITTAQNAPQKIALQDADTSITFGDLDSAIDARMTLLQDVSVLGIALDNSVDWVLWDLAALKAEIICVPLPPFFSAEQMAHTVKTACITHIVRPEGIAPTGLAYEDRLPKGTAKVTFTSGTTGTPKGVCLSRTAMENVARNIVGVLGEGFSQTHMSVLPLAVLLENIAGVYAALIAGCTVILPSLSTYGADYKGLHDQLSFYHAQSAILVPEILRTLMAQVAMKGALPNLKFIAVGGAKINPFLIERARAMGLPVYEGYGLSECASVVSMNTPENDKSGSVGKLLPHVKFRVHNGEIEIKTNGFLGYVGEPAPEIFATGDLGDIDNDGYVSVTGRKKNVLITSYGRNVSPEWVEAALLAHPAIAQAIVYGDGHPFLSALIVPMSKNTNTAQAIAQVNSSLPEYARINEFHHVPPFTAAEGLLTGNGRPRRERILNLYTQGENHEVLRSTC